MVIIMRENDTGIRAVDRALSILDCFSKNENSFSLTELSRKAELSPSTTLRVLDTLEQRHYLYRDPSSLRYYLGYRLAQISNIAFENMELTRLAQPEMEELNREFDESVGIYLLEGIVRVCMARVESTQRMRSVYSIGSQQPLTRGASGRVILAYQPEEMIESLLATDPFTTKDELAKVRKAGVAVSMGEREKGLVSVSAPLFNATMACIGALFISSPMVRTSSELIETMKDSVRLHAQNISKQMGYVADRPHSN